MRPLRILIPGLLALLVLLLVLPACACRHCEREQDRLLTQWGHPEQREIRKDDNLVTETWRYPSSDRTVVFLWDDRDCSCNVSTYSIPGGREGAQSPDPNQESNLIEEAGLPDLRPARRNPTRP